MAATAGTMTLLGKSGRTYTINVYVPDAASTQWTFNPSGLAASTSPTTYRVPEDCVFTEVALLAAPTATAGVLQINGATANGVTFNHSANLVSLATRQKFAAAVRGGDFIGVLQS